MIAHKEIFRDVRFAGDLVGHGRVIVSPGRLKVRERCMPRLLIVLLCGAALALIALLVAWRATWASGIVAALVVFTALTVVLSLRAYLAVILVRDPYHPILRRSEYDVSRPTIDDAPSANADHDVGEPSERRTVIRFLSRDPRRALHALDVSFREAADADRCHRLFMGSA